MLRLWERACEDGGSATPGAAIIELAARARSDLRKLSEMALMFPVTRARVAHCRGLYAWLRGRHNKARRAWSKGLESARQVGLDYDQGLLQLELGSRGVLPARRSRAALEAARDLLESCEAKSQLERCHAALAASD